MPEAWRQWFILCYAVCGLCRQPCSDTNNKTGFMCVELSWAGRGEILVLFLFRSVVGVWSSWRVFWRSHLWWHSLWWIAINMTSVDKWWNQNYFAIDGDGARIVAPWIVAFGVKKDGDKDGFDEFNVKCSGAILTNNIVIREALLKDTNPKE